MTFGPASLLALVAALLATLAWFVVRRLALPEWACMLLFGLFLALVVIAGPLVKLP